MARHDAFVDHLHPKVVQERLGHSSIAITLDIYSHVAPGMQEDAAAKLGAIVFGGAGEEIPRAGDPEHRCPTAMEALELPEDGTETEL
jgi:hypothetical protein